MTRLTLSVRQLKINAYLVSLFFYVLLLCKNCPTNELHISHSIYACTYGCFVSKSVPICLEQKKVYSLC